MQNRLLSWLRPTAAQQPTGFVYVSNEEIGPMRDARAGATIRVEGRGPPWIVVDRDPAAVILARWPGRLWRVRIVEAATERDQRHVGGPPLPYARYTRCISVAVEAEENIAVLFGPHGSSVVRVLEEASRLSRSQAEALAANRHADAAAAQDRAWRSWLQQEGIPDEVHDQYDGTLQMGGQKWGSPINGGLAVLHDTVFKRAQFVDGDAATESDEEDTWLVRPWDGAGRVLGDAALALGAPEHMNDEDRAVLLGGWLRVFGGGYSERPAAISPAARTSWKTLPCPVEREALSLPLLFSDEEGERLRFGHIPADMDEKWFIFFEDGWLYFHRSWTSDCIFGVKLDGSPAGVRVVEAWASRDRQRYNPQGIEQEKQLIIDLIRSRLLD